jgi:hypothetical protein
MVVDRGRSHPEYLTLTVVYTDDTGDGGTRTKTKITFDVEIWHETDTFVLVSPRTRTAKGNGCVKFVINPKYGDRITIDTIAYDSKCAASGSSLSRKSGTRRMVIGAMHCVRDLAETRWPALRGFELHDQGAYMCPPLDMELRTTASDLLLQDSTYYERHYNLKIELPEVADAKLAALEKIHAPVAMSFAEFWAIVLPNVEMYLTNAKHAWLTTHKDAIERSFGRKIKTDPDTTWRTLMTLLHKKYGCTFFAATLTQFAHHFGMMPFLGAAYVVDFANIPPAIRVVSKIHTTVELGCCGCGCGGRSSSSFPSEKMTRLKLSAHAIEFQSKTAHTFVHRRRHRRLVAQKC